MPLPLSFYCCLSCQIQIMTVLLLFLVSGAGGQWREHRSVFPRAWLWQALKRGNPGNIARGRDNFLAPLMSLPGKRFSVEEPTLDSEEAVAFKWGVCVWTVAMQWGYWGPKLGDSLNSKHRQYHLRRKLNIFLFSCWPVWENELKPQVKGTRILWMPSLAFYFLSVLATARVCFWAKEAESFSFAFAESLRLLCQILCKLIPLICMRGNTIWWRCKCTQLLGFQFLIWKESDLNVPIWSNLWGLCNAKWLHF